VISHEAFIMTASVATAGVSVWWVSVDVMRLRRSLRERPRTGWVRDRIFGSVIGISCGLIGVSGIILYHLR